MSWERQRGGEIMQGIRDVLLHHWNPIGVPEIPLDEYDSYIGPIYRILASTRSENDLVEFLYRTGN